MVIAVANSIAWKCSHSSAITLATVKANIHTLLLLQVEAEQSLLLLQQQFDVTLAELKSKAEILSSKLDEEAANKKQAETEVADLFL